MICPFNLGWECVDITQLTFVLWHCFNFSEMIKKRCETQWTTVSVVSSVWRHVSFVVSDHRQLHHSFNILSRITTWAARMAHSFLMCPLERASVEERVSMSSWWRHQMETFSALLAFCAGNSPVTSNFPSQRPVTRSFDVFFDLRLTERLGKQSWGWWFEKQSHPLWRHNNADVLIQWVTPCNVYR